jgi:hypothetical protein
MLAAAGDNHRGRRGDKERIGVRQGRGNWKSFEMVSETELCQIPLSTATSLSGNIREFAFFGLKVLSMSLLLVSTGPSV